MSGLPSPCSCWPWRSASSSSPRSTPRRVAPTRPQAATRARSAWSYRPLVLGAVGIFVYVGAEVAIGSFLVNYFKEPAIGGARRVGAAPRTLPYYWGGAMVGPLHRQRRRCGCSGPASVLAVHALVAAALVVLTMLATGHVAMGAILLVGLFNSIMFPTIFTLAIDGLGKHTGQGSGILCMAIVGGALIPVVQGPSPIASASITASCSRPLLPVHRLVRGKMAPAGADEGRVGARRRGRGWPAGFSLNPSPRVSGRRRQNVSCSPYRCHNARLLSPQSPRPMETHR